MFVTTLLVLLLCSSFVLNSCTTHHTQTMKTILNTTNAPAPIGPYSQGVRAKGELFFFSGQIALRADGTMVQGGVREQTRQVCENIKALLESQHLNFNNVVKTTVFLKDMNEFAAMNEVYAEFFSTSAPARSTVEVARLPKDVRVEIEVIAVSDGE